MPGAEIFTVKPSEDFQEGNPYNAQILPLDEYAYAVVRIEPPCLLNDEAIRIACESEWPVFKIKHDKVVSTAAATTIDMFMSEAEEEKYGAEKTKEAYTSVVRRLLDRLGATESLALFKNYEEINGR